MCSDRDARELESELENYRKMVGSSMDAILATDVDGRITFANPAVRFYGYSPSDLIGRRIFEFLHPKYVDVVKRSIERSTATGQYQRVEVEIRDKSGSYRWVEAVGEKAEGERGDVQNPR